MNHNNDFFEITKVINRRSLFRTNINYSFTSILFEVALFFFKVDYGKVTKIIHFVRENKCCDLVETKSTTSGSAFWSSNYDSHWRCSPIFVMYPHSLFSLTVLPKFHLHFNPLNYLHGFAILLCTLHPRSVIVSIHLGTIVIKNKERKCDVTQWELITGPPNLVSSIIPIELTVLLERFPNPFHSLLNFELFKLFWS